MIDSKTLIIIPVFNGEKNIKRSLDSCIVQSSKSQILVIDNCSTDKTQSIVKSYCEKNNNVDLIVNKKNIGRIGNFNTSLDFFMNSNYKYLKFVFSGDELVTDSVRVAEEIFFKNKNLSMVNGSYIINKGKKKEVVSKYFTEDRKADVKELIKIGVYPSGATGTLNSITYSKNGIGKLRVNPVFLGIAMFHNKILLYNGDIFYTNKILGIYNLDSHKSYSLQFDYLYKYEYAFSKLYSLQEAKHLFTEKEFQKIKNDTVIQLITECLWIGKIKLFTSVVYQMIKTFYVKIISKFKYRK